MNYGKPLTEIYTSKDGTGKVVSFEPFEHIDLDVYMDITPEGDVVNIDMDIHTDAGIYSIDEDGVGFLPHTTVTIPAEVVKACAAEKRMV